MAAQLLHHLAFSEQTKHSLLHNFIPSPSSTLNEVPPLFHHFARFGSPALTSFHLLNILPPHSYTILLLLAAQLLHHFTHFDPLPSFSCTISAQLLIHFTRSEQINHSRIHHFIPLGSPAFTSFYPSKPEQFTPSFLHDLLPLAAQLLHHVIFSEQITHTATTILPAWVDQLLRHITPSDKNYTLTLTRICPLWQLNSYIISPSQDNLSTLLHLFTRLCSPALSLFYHLPTSYPHVLTQFYPFWQLNSYLVLLHLNTYHLIFTPF